MVLMTKLLLTTSNSLLWGFNVYAKSSGEKVEERGEKVQIVYDCEKDFFPLSFVGNTLPTEHSLNLTSS